MKEFMDKVFKVLRDIKEKPSAGFVWGLAESNIGLYMRNEGLIDLHPPNIKLTDKGVNFLEELI